MPLALTGGGAAGSDGDPGDYEALVAEGGAVPVHTPAPTDPVAYAYTAGTTGLPKGVVWTHAGMLEGMRWLCANVGLRHEDRWLSALPAAAGPLIFVSMNLVNGMATVLPGGRFAPDRMLELIARERVTGTMLVPTMLSDALAAVRGREADTSTLRLLCYGSMPATPAVIRAARDVFGCEVQQWYGSTEMTGIVSILRDADHAAALDGREYLLSSCGRPMMHAEMQIRDESGAALPPGEIGEVWVSSSALFGGYHKRPEETRSALVDGWFRPGDIGRLDAEGYLYVLDRKNFMIISGGYNVYPAVVENALAEHRAVREVAVVGAPHPRWGEAVAALVTVHAGATVEPHELVEFGRARLAGWEYPKHVEIVDELPRGATGKMDRRSIRDRFRADPGRLPW